MLPYIHLFLYNLILVGRSPSERSERGYKPPLRGVGGWQCGASSINQAEPTECNCGTIVIVCGAEHTSQAPKPNERQAEPLQVRMHLCLCFGLRLAWLRMRLGLGQSPHPAICGFGERSSERAASPIIEKPKDLKCQGGARCCRATGFLWLFGLHEQA